MLLIPVWLTLVEEPREPIGMRGPQQTLNNVPVAAAPAGASAMPWRRSGTSSDWTTCPCDVWRFRENLDQGEPKSAPPPYGGAFLDGFYLDRSRRFEEWVELERHDLHRA